MLLCLSVSAFAVFSWENADGSHNWNVPGNWDPMVTPDNDLTHHARAGRAPLSVGHENVHVFDTVTNGDCAFCSRPLIDEKLADDPAFCGSQPVYEDTIIPEMLPIKL